MKIMDIDKTLLHMSEQKQEASLDTDTSIELSLDTDTSIDTHTDTSVDTHSDTSIGTHTDTDICISINFLKYIYNVLLESEIFTPKELMFDGIAILADDLRGMIMHYIETISTNRAVKNKKLLTDLYSKFDILILKQLEKMDKKIEAKRAYKEISKIATTANINGDAFNIIRYQDARKLMPHKYPSTYVLSGFDRVEGTLSIFFPLDEEVEETDGKVGISDEQYDRIVSKHGELHSRIIFNAIKLKPWIDMHAIFTESIVTEGASEFETGITEFRKRLEDLAKWKDDNLEKKKNSDK